MYDFQSQVTELTEIYTLAQTLVRRMERLWNNKKVFAVCLITVSSRKTVNARENFWNVYCFATNQTRDETAKDNRQTAARQG